MTTASVDIVIQGQNKASAALQAAADQMKRLSGSTQSAATAMKALAGIQIGAMLSSAFSSATSFVTGYAKALADAKDQLNDIANRTGFAVEALQSLGWAAQMAGVEGFTKGIQKFTIELGKAIQEGKSEAFADLGLNLNELALLAPEEQFRAIGDAISRLPTEAERAAAAVKLFGKSGIELVPLFSESMAEAEAQAERLGIVLSTTQVSAIAEMNDSLDMVKGSFEGIISQVVGNLAPAVTSIAQEFLGFVEGFQGIGGETGGNALATTITNAFLDIAGTMASLFDYVIAGFKDFSASLDYTVKVFNMVADIFTAVAESMKFGFNLFRLAGGALTEGFGMLLEGLGSWVSSDLEAFGRGLKEQAAQQRVEVVDSMNESAQRVQRAASDAFFGRQPGGQPEGEGPASRAVAAARAAMENRRDGKSAEQEESERQKRAAAVAQMERDRMMAARAKEFAETVKAGADAIKGLSDLVGERDKLEKERADRMAAPTPENQAFVDRFLSRGPQLDATQRTAAATEKLAELNQKIKEKQEIATKATEAIARNTANMFGLVMP